MTKHRVLLSLACAAALTAVSPAAALMAVSPAAAVLAAAPPAAAAAPTPAAPAPARTVAGKARPLLNYADKQITASRDLAASATHAGVLWTFNSNAKKPQLFAIGPTGKTVATYSITGATHWNTIAVSRNEAGKPTLLLGDVGDFGGDRAHGIAIHEILEPARLASGRLHATRYQLAYPDGNHDADTLLAEPTDGRAYVITRSPAGAVVYALPSILGPNMRNKLTRLRTLHFAVEGGTFVRDGRVVLRGRRTVRVLAGIRGDVQNVVQLPAGLPAECLTVSSDSRELLIGAQGRHARVWAVALPAAKGAASEAPASKTISYHSSGPLGGVVGMVSLAGVVVIAVAGVGLYLRGRRRRT